MAEAIAWERMAIALGTFEGCRAGEGRISFRHLPGWYEGPYDVQRWVYRKQGRAALATEAEEKCKKRRWRGGRLQKANGQDLTI